MRLIDFWKPVVRLMAGFALLAVAMTFAGRLPDQYTCIGAVDASTASPDNRYLFDINRGLYLKDNPRLSFALYSPNGEAYITLKSEKGNTGLNDLYLHNTKQNSDIPLEMGMYPSYSNQGLGSYIVWTSDSRRIAYLWASPDKQMHLTVVNADGTDKQTVDVLAPDGVQLSSISSLLLNAWSADGEYLSIAARGVEIGFWLWSTRPLQRMASELDGQPLKWGTWSPSGHTFAGLIPGDQPQLALITPGEPFKIVTSDIPSLSYEHIAWSPDGNYLALSGVNPDCSKDGCPLYWRHDIFAKDGKHLRSALWSNPAISSGIGEYFTGSGGQITLTGHILTARWQPQDHNWVFLQEEMSDQKPTLDLVALDVENDVYQTVAHDIATDYADDLYTNQLNGVAVSTPSSASFDSIPMIPSGNRIMLPTWEDGKISIDLADLNGQKRKSILKGANALVNIWAYSSGGIFWAWENIGIVAWMTGQGS